MLPDGSYPDGITAQAEQAWKNVLAILAQAGMGVKDLVKVTHYLVRQEDIKDYVVVRARYLGDARPASMLLVVPGLVKPEILVEIEACAARQG
jgi:enamine deaminase RidA (YjgF/YER057c/UK114 family)